MLADLKATIFTFFYNRFHHWMAPLGDPLPIHSQHVSVYLNSLLAANNSKGTKKLREWKLIESRGFKVPSLTRHEYVVTDVRDPDGSHHYIAIERMVGDPAVPTVRSELDLSQLTLRDSLFSSKSSLSSICDSSLPDRHAKDRIFILPSWKKDKKDELIGTFLFTNPDNDTSPSIYELTILANLIHKSGPRYLLFTKNCYHYAGTILAILREAYAPVVKMEGHARKWWCRLDLFTEYKGSISTLCESLQKTAADHVVSFFFCQVIW